MQLELNLQVTQTSCNTNTLVTKFLVTNLKITIPKFYNAVRQLFSAIPLLLENT